MSTELIATLFTLDAIGCFVLALVAIYMVRNSIWRFEEPRLHQAGYLLSGIGFFFAFTEAVLAGMFWTSVCGS